MINKLHTIGAFDLSTHCVVCETVIASLVSENGAARGTAWKCATNGTVWKTWRSESLLSSEATPIQNWTVDIYSGRVNRRFVRRPFLNDAQARSALLLNINLINIALIRPLRDCTYLFSKKK